MDQHLLWLINATWTSPWLDLPMAALSSWDLWWPFALVGGVLAAIFGGFRWRAFLAVAGMAVGVTDGLVVGSVKDLTGRPRPHEAMAGVRTLDLAKARPRVLALAKPLKSEISTLRILPPYGKSFPSGHSANTFAVATVCAVFFRRRGWLAFIPAALVAYSRIYVGAHWPLDVAVSFLLGTGLALLVCAGADFLWRRIVERWLPRLHLAHPSLLAP